MTPHCRTCKFWPWRVEGLREGECKRNAPSTRPGLLRVWPITQAIDWCGDYEERPDATPV